MRGINNNVICSITDIVTNYCDTHTWHNTATLLTGQQQWVAVGPMLLTPGLTNNGSVTTTDKQAQTIQCVVISLATVHRTH